MCKLSIVFLYKNKNFIWSVQALERMKNFHRLLLITSFNICCTHPYDSEKPNFHTPRRKFMSGHAINTQGGIIGGLGSPFYIYGIKWSQFYISEITFPNLHFRFILCKDWQHLNRSPDQGYWGKWGGGGGWQTISFVCFAQIFLWTCIFVSPELSSERDYVITHSVRSMSVCMSRVYEVCSMWYFAKLITVSTYIDVFPWDLGTMNLG